MRELLRILVYVLLIMALGVLIWTLIPEKQEEHVMSIVPDFPLFSKKKECEEVKDILNRKFSVINSRSIRKGESGVVLVIIEETDLNEINKNKDDELLPCGISLEVWINDADVVAEPGDKIILPFLNVRSQTFRIDVFPKSNQEIKGTVWISAIFPGDNSMSLERIPIFAVPLVIQVHSLFGLSIVSIRIISSSLIFFALILVNHEKFPGKKS